jgi:hypothetical protein
MNEHERSLGGEVSPHRFRGVDRKREAEWHA